MSAQKKTEKISSGKAVRLSKPEPTRHRSRRTQTETAAHVFLFDAGYPGVPNYYGGVFDPAFLQALSSIDPHGHTSSRVLRGDAIVSSLCTKTTAVSRLRDARGRDTQSATQSHDTDLYGTIVWDVADAISTQWHTIDDERFPYLLARHNLHCICLPTFPLRFRDKIDSILKRSGGYCGAFEIDPGNPIQRKIFLGLLIDYVFIKRGNVFLRKGIDEQLEGRMTGADQFRPNGVRILDWKQFDQLQPAARLPTALSKRGKISSDRLEGKRNLTIKEKVAEALYRATLSDEGDLTFSFETSEMRPGFEEIVIPVEKFTKYLLNPENPQNKGKAQFFFEELGIDAGNWRYLAGQVAMGVRKALIRKPVLKQYPDSVGIRFSVIIPVRGLNGKTATIETGWSVESGKPAHFVTATPAARKDRFEGDAQVPIVAPSSLQGESKWQEVFRLAQEAGRQAAADCVPTPMKIEGYPVIMEGMCGGAYVRVPDARSGFARWLVKTGRDNKHYKTGVQVIAQVKSQSLERSAAYARAFAMVLQQNGISCEVFEYPD